MKSENIDNLRNLPVLSVKIGQNSHKYIEEFHGIIKPDYEEIVIKTKKGDVIGRNENYGEIWKKLTKNEVKFLNNDEKEEEDISALTSISNIEEKKDNSIKEILRESIQKITKQEEQRENLSKKSGFIQISKIPMINEEKTKESSIEKLERWELENAMSPNEENGIKQIEMFSERDYKYLNFPRNLMAEMRYFEENSMESPVRIEKNEETVLKKKMKNYMEFQSKKKEDVSDEARVYFKDYETLCKSNRWESGNKSNRSNGGKQENVGNLNYKIVRNFQSKN